MPTVHAESGFEVRIYLPPREHHPPHVHVIRAGGEVIINLGQGEAPPDIREVHRMSTRDAICAYRIVERIRDDLLLRWREYHG
jgi:hypothetical protein